MKRQNREIILRVKAPDGQYRMNVMSRDTYGELLLQVKYPLSSQRRKIIFPSRISWSPEKMERLSLSVKELKLEMFHISSMEPFLKLTLKTPKSKMFIVASKRVTQKILELHQNAIILLEESALIVLESETNLHFPKKMGKWKMKALNVIMDLEENVLTAPQQTQKIKLEQLRCFVNTDQMPSVFTVSETNLLQMQLISLLTTGWQKGS